MPKLKLTCPRKTKNSWSPWSQSGWWKRGGCPAPHETNYVVKHRHHLHHQQQQQQQQTLKHNAIHSAATQAAACQATI